MIHSALQILWLALPVGAWLVNLRRLRRVHPALLYVIVCIAAYVLLISSVFAYDSYLKSRLYTFDLNGDGGFDDSEMTPAAQQAMDDFTHDTGRTFAPVFGAPVTAIWVLVNFVVLYGGEWIFRVTTGRDKTDEVLGEFPSKIEPANTDPNPYRSPNAG